MKAEQALEFYFNEIFDLLDKAGVEAYSLDLSDEDPNTFVVGRKNPSIAPTAIVLETSAGKFTFIISAKKEQSI